MQQSREGRLGWSPDRSGACSRAGRRTARRARQSSMQAYYAGRVRPALAARTSFSDRQVPAVARPAAAELPDMHCSQAPPATDGELALVHTPAYVHDAISDGLLSAPAHARNRLSVEPGDGRAGAPLGRRHDLPPARAALQDGVAANIAGGTHHAHADRGGGFCVFNDAAVASRLMQAEAHRTASIAAECAGDRPRRSSRQRHGPHLPRRPERVHALAAWPANFPFRKEASDLDVDLPDGCGDDALPAGAAFGAHSGELRRASEPPGLVIYLAGADPHEGDRLGRLKLTWDGLDARDRRGLRCAGERGLPVATSMAGGYGTDIDDTVTVHLRTVGEALRSAALWRRRTARCEADFDSMKQSAA